MDHDSSTTPTLTTRQPNGYNVQERPNLPRQRSRHFESFQPSMYNPYNTGLAGGSVSPSLYTPMPMMDKQGGYFADANWAFVNPNPLPSAPEPRIKGAPYINTRSRVPGQWAELTPSENTPSIMSPRTAEKYAHDTLLAASRIDEEIIPTAIVIKNIPFAVKKEQLLEVMTKLNVPLPYAFNYHFDDRGVFRGLSFANFSAPEEATVVVNTLSGYEIAGRRLRVEYKKMLPAHERERIEREKQERRGQLLEQHMAPPALIRTPSGLHPGNNTSKSPLTGAPLASPAVELNLNDPETLELYSQILLFKDDSARDELIFPASLSPHQRRTVHVIASKFGLYHVSRNEGEDCAVHVTRQPSRTALERPSAFNMNRSLTAALLEIPTSAAVDAKLRSARSYTDIRSASPAFMGAPGTAGSENVNGTLGAAGVWKNAESTDVPHWTTHGKESNAPSFLRVSSSGGSPPSLSKESSTTYSHMSGNANSLTDGDAD